MSGSTWDTTPLAAIPGDRSGVDVDGFQPFPERSKGERERRIELGKKRLSFGIKFLDAALGGIFPHDLILLGAKTGRGKTHAAMLCAIANAEKRRHVHYLALEAEKDEIERRAKFSLLSNLVRSSCRTNNNYAHMERMNYLDWYAGDLDDITGPFEEYADRQLSTRFQTLHTFYRSKAFYAERFEELMNEIKDETDLVILDHLHFVDSDDSNDLRGYKAITKKIRDSALALGKPVVVVAHLRKSDRRSERIVPDEEDFHGTSDVPKMATKAVLLAPAFDLDSGDPCLWPTYINPAKCRPDGSRSRYVGRVMFDARSGKYLDDFELGKMSLGGDKFEIADASKLPAWAKR